MKKLVFSIFVFLAAGAAWSVSIAAHELLGHGGVCALDPQCTWLYVDAMYFSGTPQFGAWKTAGLAAGSVLNVLIGVLAFIFMLRFRHRLGVFLIPLHLLVSVSFIQAGAYIGLGGFIHEGMDFAQLIAMSETPARTKVAFLIVGGVFVLFGVVAAKVTAPLQRGQSAEPISWPRYLWISYLGFSATALAASAFVPADDRWFMLAGGLGGGALFMSFYLLGLLPFPPLKSQPASTPTLAQQHLAIIFSALAIIAYVVFLGSGVHFGQN